jgi:UDP-GlcNAc:undecaprenyl-phosphate GlcNAc-1-phosphate transferase
LPFEARLLTGLGLAVATVYWITPVAIRVAHRLAFYDRPTGYKGHAAPTPYLGGAAVVVGFLAATLVLTGDWRRTVPLTIGVVVLWLVGTLDDRRTVTPLGRIAVELSLAGLLWRLDLGWNLGLGPAVDLVVTAFWVVAVVNAFNLFDNMDGAATTMASVVAGGVMLLGIAQGDPWLSVVAAALCGACLGFLPHNLASPARIFLGDGGSMPIGFAVAALAMIGVSSTNAEWQSLAMGLLFVGVPALDTALVVVSRTRRGVSILTGGRDHLTHRARQRLRTARAVALALGGVQAVISALALIAIRGGSTAILAAVLLYLVGIGVAIAVLDTRLAPMGPAAATPGPSPAADVIPRSRHLARLPRSLPLVLPLALGLGISPFFSGFYDSQIWVPAGLGLVVLITAGLVARPLRVSRTAVMAVVGLGGLAVWALASSLWTESIEQAVIDGNRWIVMTAVLASVLLVVRSDRSAMWMVGALTTTAVLVGSDTVLRMLGSDSSNLFVAGRLDWPLGYVNGQASFYLLALWPCVALAEQRRWPALSGLGLGAASLLTSLLVLSQSRGIAIAALASTILVLALIPGRLRRAWALVVLAAGIALALPELLDVYEQGRGSGALDAAASQAATAALLAALGAGVVWGGVTWAAQHAEATAARLRPVAAGAMIAGVVAALGLAIASSDRMTRTIDEQYTAFVRLGIEPQGSGITSAASTTRLASGAGTRYDYWRIAWGVFGDHPILGTGAGNYDRPYFERRATTEDVRQPHSVELQALSELGLVGALLLLAFVIALGAGAYHLARAGRDSSAARFLAVSAGGAVVAWLVHTSVDWIHLLPGVTGAALAFAAVLLVRREPESAERAGLAAAGRRRRPRIASAVVVAVALAVAGVSLSRQGLAEHFRLSAQKTLAAEPANALRLADRALRLDPESVSSYYVKSAALARFNEPAAAQAALLSAAQREPHDFVTWALLGDLAVRTGDLEDAERFYGRAIELNPRDPALRAAARDAPAAIRRGASGG